jgi:P27 family predicted phage terminase small subunit
MRRLTDTEKRASGTYKATRATGEPIQWEQLHATPEPPPHLDGIAQEVWIATCENLLQRDMLAVTYLLTIEGLAVSYSTWRKCLDSIDRHGIETVIVNGAGVKTIKPNPSVKSLTAALSQMLAYADRLGFNPKANENIRVHPQPQLDTADSLLK